MGDDVKYLIAGIVAGAVVVLVASRDRPAPPPSSVSVSDAPYELMDHDPAKALILVDRASGRVWALDPGDKKIRWVSLQTPVTPTNAPKNDDDAQGVE